MLIYRQSQKSPYTNVSVLILRWEEEKNETANHANQELAALEQVFRERYNYRTERWVIPAKSNASVKLGIRIQSFLERQSPDHLLVVYYAGHAYVAMDNQLFWAR